MSGKFSSKEKVNFEPFATITIQMVNTVDYGLERNESILTRKYLKPEEKPELKNLLELDDELYRVLRGIVSYSVKIVNLSNSNRTSKQQVEAFADYIDNLDKPALAFHIKQGNVTEQEFQDIITNIRKQDDLLAAMRAAQPIIQFVLLHIDMLTNVIKHQESKAAAELEDAIDVDYAKEIAYVNMLLARRDIVLEALLHIDEHYQGNSKGLKALNRSQVLSRLGLKSRSINKTNVKLAEKDLVGTLTEIQHQLDLLEKDNDFYVKVHQELDNLVKLHDQEIRQAKGVIQLWSGAHAKMANGVTDPADWFDLTNPAGEFFDLVKTIVKR